MRSAAFLLAPLACAILACADTPSGPGQQPIDTGATGSIYVSAWVLADSGDTDMQIWRVSAADGSYEQIETPFKRVGTEFDVDIGGSGVLFSPPRASFAWMPEFDPSGLVIPNLRTRRISPKLSPDLGAVASVIDEQFTPLEIRIYYFATQFERAVATVPVGTLFDINHWYAGGDSLLVSWVVSLGKKDYFIVHADSSGVTPFNLPLVRNAFYLGMSPDESHVAISTPFKSTALGWATNVIEVLALNPPRVVLHLDLPYRAGPIAWSPDGRYLAHAPGGPYQGDDYLKYPVLEIIEVATGERTPLIMQRPPGGLAYGVRWATQ